MSGGDEPAAPLAELADSDPWRRLRTLTPARVALGRSGTALPTAEVLGFGHSHALARDAVHRELDVPRLGRDLAALGLDTLQVASAATDRATYLRRPDLGRQLSPDGASTLQAAAADEVDLAVVVGDGLSAVAVQANAVPLLAAMLPGVRAAGWRLAPVVVATQARVALGDEIGETLRARMVLLLIGERPGLSSPDSLGAYLTFAPRRGRRDNERNCVSNVRAAGLAPERASVSLLWLLTEALRRGATGVTLKDESAFSVRLGGPPTIEA